MTLAWCQAWRPAKSGHYVRLGVWFPAKERALVQSSSLSICAPVQGPSFIVNLGNGALSMGVATLAPDEGARTKRDE
jgi:hypothetical protein